MINATVLFVDDEEFILRAMERLFIDHPNIRVLKALNAMEGLKIIEQEEIHVLVSDNQMPGMKGVEFLSMVKNISPDTVKVLMTAHADLAMAINAINQGGISKFIVKPWSNDQLVEIVEEGINSYVVVKTMKQADEATILSLAQTIELKDSYTRGHCERVAKYSIMIADQLNLLDKVKKEIIYGSWLHDCGKIGIPESILNFNGPLSSEQWEIMRRHPSLGAGVAKKALFSQTIIDIILYHHERCNGKGYPEGLRGERIPVEAKIVAIADTFDAITSDRPYRKKHSFQEGISILSSLKEDQLDSKFVELFISQVESSEFLKADGE